MFTREVLTLQFGHYSNYVGTHWWNIQEMGFEYNTAKSSEINHDVLYREGVTSKDQTTFTPRLLLADLRGSLRSLPEQGDLYESNPEADQVKVLWENPAEIKAETSIKKSKYQEEIEAEKPTETYKLEDEVAVWSDYLYTRFHPRTINVIKEYQHEDEQSPFNIFPLGSNLWKSESFEGDFADKIRNYMEECDSFQGYQILFDSTDANSGLATSCIEYLRDECENKTIFGVPIIPNYYADHRYPEDNPKRAINDSNRVLNLLLGYTSLCENASIFVPLSTGSDGWRYPGAPRKFNHINYNNEKWFHSSAILASALDTFTLKYRLKQSSYSLSDLAVDLTSSGRKAAAASLCVPFSLNLGTDLIDCLDNWEGPLTQSITPSCKLGNSRMMQLITLRGVGEDRLKRPPADAGKQKDMPAYKCKNVMEMLQMYYSYTHHASATGATSIEKALPVKKPYPDIFDDRLGVNGNVIAVTRPQELHVESIPVLSGLHQGVEVGGMLLSLHAQAKKIKFAKFHHFNEAGVDKDQYVESLDKLLDFKECYDDDYLI